MESERQINTKEIDKIIKINQKKKMVLFCISIREAKYWTRINSKKAIDLSYQLSFETSTITEWGAMKNGELSCATPIKRKTIYSCKKYFHPHLRCVVQKLDGSTIKRQFFRKIISLIHFWNYLSETSNKIPSTKMIEYSLGSRKMR